MFLSTPAQYADMVTALQAKGFSGFPPASEIDFTAVHPVSISVAMQHAKITVAPWGDNIAPSTSL